MHKVCGDIREVSLVYNYVFMLSLCEGIDLSMLEWFEVKQGVRQSWSMLMWLLNTFLSVAVQQAHASFEEGG